MLRTKLQFLSSNEPINFLLVSIVFCRYFGDVCGIKTTYNDETHAIQRVRVAVCIDRYVSWRSLDKPPPTLQKYNCVCLILLHISFIRN